MNKMAMGTPVHEPIPVAVADDHDLMREGVAARLEGSGRYRVTVHARHGLELVRALEGGAQVALAIVDLGMPVMDGYAVLDWLKEHRPRLRVLVYTLFGDDATVIRSYRGGAHGLLRKEEQADNLLPAVDAVAAGAVYHTEYSQRVLLENPDGLSVEERRRARLLAQMSPRQLEVLRLICRGDNPTYEHIAQEMKLSRRTVERYASELFELFGVNSKTLLVISAIRLGLADVRDTLGTRG
jgi:two-component system invasion response regulator UvrY